jgi:hypothetical protein
MMSDQNVVPAAQLSNQAVDYVASAAKAVLSAAPFVGSALAEFAGVVIPNQRMDRVAAFAIKLEERLSTVELSVLKQRLVAPEFGDVVEESMRQAAASLSDERRNYLASVVHEALDTEQISAVDSRHILRLLGEINDVEVIVLRAYLVETLNGDEDFRKRHAAVLDPVSVHLGSSQREREQEALWEGYRLHLTQLGLLQRKLAVDRNTKLPIFDPKEGLYKSGGHGLTSLGRLMLKMIGLSDDGFSPREDVRREDGSPSGVDADATST